MHIASALPLVRRDSVQTDIARSRVDLAPGRLGARKYLPGAILLTVLVLLGGLFPILF